MSSVYAGSSIFSSIIVDTEKLQNDIFSGDFTINLDAVAWKPPSWKLHIFLSSTFSDVMLEHRCLMGKILPPLQFQARCKGIDMSIIDMDIDIDEDDNEARHLWRIIESEIDRCKSSSSGLFFLSLLSLKYGRCPLVHLIDAKVFEEWCEDNIDSDLYELLSKWYIRNDDFDPPRFMLRRFKPDESAAVFKLINVLWERMPELPFSYANSALLAGHSLLEWQALHAIYGTDYTPMMVEEPSLRCYWIHRSFKGGVHKVDDEDEVYSDAYDESTQRKLTAFKDTLGQTLGSLNRVKEYSNLQWRSYISRIDGECEKYMGAWEMDTRKLLTAQLQTIIAQKQQWETEGHGKGVKGSIIEEILHHTQIARARNDTFTGREELLNRCLAFINGDTRQSTGNGLDGVFLCISGKPGYGKSSFVARLAGLQYHSERMGSSEPRPVITRFCGTSLRSSTGHRLIKSICRQIHLVKGISAMRISPVYEEAVEHFHSLMNTYRIILILDGVDSLSNEHLARGNLSFLQGIRPHTDSRIIVTTLPEELDLVTAKWTNFYGCLTRLEMSNVPCLELLPYSISSKYSTYREAQVSLAYVLSLKGLRLSAAEYERIMQTVEEEPTPLYVTLAAFVIEKWIYGQWERVLVPGSVRLLSMILDNVERTYGQLFVTATLSLLTFAVEGLTHAELMDTISMNDDVMSDVFMKHNIQYRVPTKHWIRLRHALGELLTETRDGRLLWTNKLFRNVAAERYDACDGDLKIKTHNILARYFGSIVDANRSERSIIPPNPLFLAYGDTGGANSEPIINRRRIVEAACHMIAAKLWLEAEAELCNAQYIWASLKIDEGHRLLQNMVDLGDALMHERGSRGVVEYHCRWLRLNMTTVQSDPTLLQNPDHSTISVQDPSDIILWIRGVNMGADAGYRALLLKLLGHTHFVRCISWNPDARRLASASNDKTVRIWDAQLGMLQVVLEGHKGWVSEVKWSPDGSRIASSSGDCTVKVWDPITGSCVGTFRGHTDWVRSLSWCPDGTLLASGSGDSSVKIWKVSSQEGVHSLTHPNGWVWCVAWKPVGDLVCTGGGDGIINLWTPSSGQHIGILKGHRSCVTCLTWAPHAADILASGSNDKSIRVWNVANCSVVHVLNAHEDVVNSVSWKPDGTMLVSASNDNHVRLWNATKGSKISKLMGHDNQFVTCVAWSPDGNAIASTGYDSMICVWNYALVSSNNAIKGRHVEVVDGESPAKLSPVRKRRSKR